MYGKCYLKIGVLSGLALVLLAWGFSPAWSHVSGSTWWSISQAFAQTPGGRLDPHDIPKYVIPLVILVCWIALLSGV